MKPSFPLGRYCLRLLPHDRPIPMDRIRLLRRLCYGADALFGQLQQTGRSLDNPFLATRFKDTEMGTWSMSPATLNFLEQQIRADRPQAILEFGSGVSTVCLARYMAELHGENSGVCVLSVEQDINTVANTNRSLREVGLDRLVKVFHAPLDRRSGRSCYNLNADTLTAIREVRPDFVLIDGPAAEDGARYDTLPDVLELLADRARFYLDDALRDGEIRIAEQWKMIPSVHIHGIRLTEKGLLTGQLNR